MATGGDGSEQNPDREDVLTTGTFDDAVWFAGSLLSDSTCTLEGGAGSSTSTPFDPSLFDIDNAVAVRPFSTPGTSTIPYQDGDFDDDITWERSSQQHAYVPESPHIKLLPTTSCEKNRCRARFYTLGAPHMSGVWYRYWLYEDYGDELPTAAQVPWRRDWKDACCLEVAPGTFGTVSIQMANEIGGSYTRLSNVINVNFGGYLPPGSGLIPPQALPTATKHPDVGNIWSLVKPGSVNLMGNPQYLKISFAAARRYIGKIDYRVWMAGGEYPLGRDEGWQTHHITTSSNSFTIRAFPDAAVPSCQPDDDDIAKLSPSGWWWVQIRNTEGYTGQIDRHHHWATLRHPHPAVAFYLDPPDPACTREQLDFSPDPLPTATPLPTLENGSRPAALSMRTSTLAGSGDSWNLKVTLHSKPYNTVQYRVWRSTGNPPSDRVPWQTVSSWSGSSFNIRPWDSIAPDDGRGRPQIQPCNVRICSEEEEVEADAAFAGWWWVQTRAVNRSGSKEPGNPGPAVSFYVSPR